MQHCIPRAPLHHLLPLCHTVACRKPLVASWVVKASPPPQGYQLSRVSATPRDPRSGQEGLPRTPSAEVWGAGATHRCARGSRSWWGPAGVWVLQDTAVLPHESAQHELCAALLPPRGTAGWIGMPCATPSPHVPMSPCPIAATCHLRVTPMDTGWVGTCPIPPSPPRPPPKVAGHNTGAFGAQRKTIYFSVIGRSRERSLGCVLMGREGRCRCWRSTALQEQP